jgi:hypothetical protein
VNGGAIFRRLESCLEGIGLKMSAYGCFWTIRLTEILERELAISVLERAAAAKTKL